MFALPSLAVAFAVTAFLMAAIAWNDLRRLKIPNKLVLAVFVTFLLTGLPGQPAGLDWGLPWETFLWRLGYAVAAFGIGFLLYIGAGGHVGAGDIKLIAAIAPFMSQQNLVAYLVIWAVVALVGLALHYVLRKALAGRETGWKAFDQNAYFPAGLALGIAIVAVLGIELTERLTPA